ncbi:hypothetical protein [Polymorphospora rubra]|uniref:EF-hand domain-containing protein n=1 Tax=Polymorphospora rubra TaxID=338584 RepID=A0A810MXW5_9ACTN|nr:hypothetical protein [Polymorphospora rubra]BCJ66016.1 hypothetical protein Prubr_30370 [Polymorphospora rubra]
MVEFIETDVDGDGYDDLVRVEVDEHGGILAQADTNGDGIIDMATYDVNGDGVAEYAEVDTDYDGIADVSYTGGIAAV